MTNDNFISPAEACTQYRALADEVDAATFFNNPIHSHTQDVWCAAKFALSFEKNICPCAVRLEPSSYDIDADFELKVNDVVYPFQTTEALEPDRKRGHEYKDPNRDMGPRHADWSAGTEMVPLVVRKAIERKISKSYARANELNLLVKVNVRAWKYDINAIRSAVSDLIIPFASVWLLSGHGLCTLFSHPMLGALPLWVQAADWDEVI